MSWVELKRSTTHEIETLYRDHLNVKTSKLQKLQKEILSDIPDLTRTNLYANQLPQTPCTFREIFSQEGTDHRHRDIPK